LFKIFLSFSNYSSGKCATPKACTLLISNIKVHGGVANEIALSG
jgi:hypothetical protein